MPHTKRRMNQKLSTFAQKVLACYFQVHTFHNGPSHHLRENSRALKIKCAESNKSCTKNTPFRYPYLSKKQQITPYTLKKQEVNACFVRECVSLERSSCATVQAGAPRFEKTYWRTQKAAARRNHFLPDSLLAHAPPHHRLHTERISTRK